MPSRWIELCPVNQIPRGTGKYVVVEEHGYAVFLHDGQVRVMDDNCPHAGASLSGGLLDAGGIVTCPMHDWYFDTCSGQCTDNPRIAVKSYPARLARGWVQIQKD